LKTGTAGSIILLADAKKSSVLNITFDPNLGCAKSINPFVNIIFFDII
jgi:hypothetical protein